MCHDLTFRHWQAICIKYLLAFKGVELVLVISDGRPAQMPHGLFQKLMRYPYRNLFFNLFEKLVLRKIPAMKPDSLNASLKKIQQLVCEPERQNRYTDVFSAEDCATIASHKPDFILRFGFNILRGEILNVATHGIWSYHHSDPSVFRGGPPALWEIFHNKAATGVVFQKLTHEIDNGIVLREGRFKTINHSYSETLNTILMGATGWALQACKDVHHGNTKATINERNGTKVPLNKYPDNLKMVMLLGKMLWNKLVFHYRDLCLTEKWNVGIISKGIAEVALGGVQGDVRWAKELPRGQYIADPFLFAGKEILVEHYDYKRALGKIDKLQVDALDENPQTVKSLAAVGHRSYPYTFQHGNEWYCIPESHGSNHTTLYKHDGLKHEWRNESELLPNFQAIDPSMVYHNDIWWLLCTSKLSDPNTQLYVFYSSSLAGPFHAHHNNPVKTDVTGARPAGNMFVYNGKLMRSAQNSAQAYGNSIKIFEVTKLSDIDFEEKLLNEITAPPDYPEGIHTLSGSSTHTVIDAKKLEFVPSHFLRKLFEKF